MSAPRREVRHAGLIALRVRGRWAGALIEGPSGVGKSDLALRALEAGFRLVTDDRTILLASGVGLYGRAPDPLVGLIEVRGLGVATRTTLPQAEIILVVRCENDRAAIERIPELARELILGVEIPRLHLCPRDFSAPAKLRQALLDLGGGRAKAYQAPCAPPG